MRRDGPSLGGPCKRHTKAPFGKDRLEVTFPPSTGAAATMEVVVSRGKATRLGMGGGGRGGESAREWVERRRGGIAKFKRAHAAQGDVVVVAVERGGGRGRKRRRPGGGVSQGEPAFGTVCSVLVETIG
jgi:hypothetical protein